MASERMNPIRSAPGKGAEGKEAISGLANLGPKSVSFLQAAQIQTREELERLGAVAAYARVKKLDPRATLNLLWALEGALTGLHWREVAREHRTSLLLALETHEQRSLNRSSSS